MFEWLYGKTFDVDADIPDLSGKVILVTGGNAGLGKETVLQLAKHAPTQIFLAARSRDKADAAITEIQRVVRDAPISYIQLDLTSFDSIREAAREVERRTERLDIVINNAGVMALPYSRTTEGYEIQFGTNHMGHALLTRLLLPLLLRTADLAGGTDVRIINVSSIGHGFAPRVGIVYDQSELERYYTLQRYGQSKLANILHAQELQRRFPTITATAVHPGIIMTDLYGAVTSSIPLGTQLSAGFAWVATHIGMAYDVPGGAKNSLWAATASRDEVRSSPFWRPVGIKHAGYIHSGKTALARELWEWTEHEFNQHGY